MSDALFKARIEQIHRDLDAYDYYQLLKIERGVAPDEIRAAFHKMALVMHPDRYQSNPDGQLRRQIYAIYKRLAEGYRVLMGDETRVLYNEGLGHGQRRLVQTGRKRVGPKAADETITHPQARKFFNMALDAERRGDLKNARINYKFAMHLAGEHPAILARIEALPEK